MIMTYTDAYNKLDTILESAITNYEIEVLTEGAKEAIKKAGEVIIIAIKKLIEIIKNLIKKIKEKLINSTNGKIDYPAGTPFDAIREDEIREKLRDMDRIIKGKIIEKNEFDTLAILKTSMPGRVEISTLKSIISNIENIQSRVKNNIDSTEKDLREYRRSLDEHYLTYPGIPKNSTTYSKQLNERIDKTINSIKALSRLEKYTVYVLTEVSKLLGNKGDKKTTVTENVGLTPKQKMAKLLLEAAAIIGDEFDEKDPSIIQDPIDDIPEEKPAIGVEQDPDVSGGAGEKLDLEEIKDLVGDDKEAIALLLDESVTIDFNK